jgi:hypothetical protein
MPLAQIVDAIVQFRSGLVPQRRVGAGMVQCAKRVGRRQVAGGRAVGRGRNGSRIRRCACSQREPRRTGAGRAPETGQHARLHVAGTACQSLKMKAGQAADARTAKAPPLPTRYQATARQETRWPVPAVLHGHARGTATRRFHVDIPAMRGSGSANGATPDRHTGTRSCALQAMAMPRAYNVKRLGETKHGTRREARSRKGACRCGDTAPSSNDALSGCGPTEHEETHGVSPQSA